MKVKDEFRWAHETEAPERQIRGVLGVSGDRAPGGGQ
jgi:hypothetical protein